MESPRLLPPSRIPGGIYLLPCGFNSVIVPGVAALASGFLSSGTLPENQRVQNRGAEKDFSKHLSMERTSGENRVFVRAL